VGLKPPEKRQDTITKESCGVKSGPNKRKGNQCGNKSTKLGDHSVECDIGKKRAKMGGVGKIKIAVRMARKGV